MKVATKRELRETNHRYGIEIARLQILASLLSQVDATYKLVDEVRVWPTKPDEDENRFWTVDGSGLKFNTAEDAIRHAMGWEPLEKIPVSTAAAVALREIQVAFESEMNSEEVLELINGTIDRYLMETEGRRE